MRHRKRGKEVLTPGIEELAELLSIQVDQSTVLNPLLKFRLSLQTSLAWRNAVEEEFCWDSPAPNFWVVNEGNA